METIEKLGKYEIKRTLGKGAMGIVYEGWDPIIARRVAIKTVRLPDTADDPETEEALARFRREAQAAGRLTHPNIVGVFDYGETNDLAYIVMEFVDGPSVKSLVDKQERFAIADTVRLMTDLLAGLKFSHDRGVVHRDIKPANIMLTSEGQGKIADFGIARIESSSMTQAGTVLGTPAYMSPEQFMGQVVDARTDIYSSGVVLYQLLTGERPFEGGMSAIMHKALNTEPVPPSQLSVTSPPAFDGVIRKAMAKRPEDRFQSAADFLAAIRAAASAQQVRTTADVVDGNATMVASSRPTAVSPPRPTPTPPSVSAQPAVAAGKRSATPMIVVAAVIVLLLAGGGAWLFLFRSSPSPTTVGRLAAGTVERPQPTQAASASAVSAVPAAPVVQPQSRPSPPSTTVSAAPPSSAAPLSTAASAAPPSTAASGAPPPTSATTAGTAPPPTPASTAPSPTPASITPSPAPATASPPSPPKVASVNLDLIRNQVAQLASSQQCAIVDGDIGEDGAVTLTGLAGVSATDALRQGLAGLTIPGAVQWQVQSVDKSFCRALDVLHSITPSFNPAAPRLGLTLVGGNTRLRDGEHILPQLVMPNFRSHLLVDYIAHDGGVQHLFPQVADPSQDVAADPVRTFAAGELVSLGAVRPGHPGWEVGPPYGTDMIIAIASSQPLFARSRPSNGEDPLAYLHALETAVQTARARGDRLAGSAITVDTLPTH
jgi:eukaryotic-like serine/threonine-protein kinase